MRKFLILSLGVAACLTMSAQDAKTLFNQAGKLEKAFTGSKPTLEFPTRKLTPELALGLLEAYDIYDQVASLDSLPNEKGEIKPKYINKIHKNLEKRAKDNDFAIAARLLYENGDLYPGAYKAFLKNGEASKAFKTVPDSIYAEDFYNAGICAFNAGQFADALKAFDNAVKSNHTSILAYTQELASIHQLAAQDTTFAKVAPEAIYECASAGVKRFGASNDYLYSSYIGNFFDKEEFGKAREILTSAIAEDPNNANLYRLRAMVGNAEHNYDASVPDFVKLGELTENYEYLREAADQLNRIGKHQLGKIDGANIAELKAQLKANIFEPAHKIAEKAKLSKDADGRINAIISDLDYTLENNL